MSILNETIEKLIHICLVRYREDTGKIIGIDLGDKSFDVPTPHGISGLDHLPETEEADEQKEPDKETVENVKKMFKVKEEDPTIGSRGEESKIVELDDDELEP